MGTGSRTTADTKTHRCPSPQLALCTHSSASSESTASCKPSPGLWNPERGSQAQPIALTLFLRQPESPPFPSPSSVSIFGRAGLRCRAQALSRCGEQGLLFVRCTGFLSCWLLLLQSLGSRAHGLQELLHVAFVAPRHVAASWARD